MEQIKDFACSYENADGIDEEIVEKLSLTFPDAYKQCNTMASIALEIQKKRRRPFCELPFCHTVEGEALGGTIKYGDGKQGPRAQDYICSRLEDVLELPKIDFEQGRIHEVLMACKMLSEKGEHVVLKVSGPFTILNTLLDVKYVFKGLKKQPELVKQVFWKLGKEMIEYIKEAKKYGVDIISYADSAGGVNILGPKYARQVTDDFTCGFVKEMEKAADGELLILLCPKTAFALTGAGKAHFEERVLPRVMTYGEACVEMIGKVRIGGQTCLNNADSRLDSKVFQEIIIDAANPSVSS